MVGRVAPMPVQRVAADSCPGVLRPHQAADGALARLRVPGGALPLTALRSLQAVAQELADGRLGLTSRGNLQVRGVDPESVGLLEARLDSLGLLPHPTHERVRNMVASPLAGRGFSSIEDVGELVPSLDAALCARADLVELPGRFLFGLDDGTGDITGEEPDVLIQAIAPGRFEVRPSGTASGVTAGRANVVEAALVAATAFLAERARQESKAWRVNELPGSSAAIVAALVADGYEPVADPTGPDLVVVDHSQSAEPVPPGLIELRDGRFAVCAVVPLGILDGEQLEALAACCEMAIDEHLAEAAHLDGYDGYDGYGSVDPELDGSVAALSPGTPLRVTPWRRVVVLDLELPAALAAQELLSAVGLVVEPGSAWARVTACAGQPGCAKSLTDVQADARVFAGITVPDGPLVHWAGCARGCGTPHSAVALLAGEGGYQVNGELPESDRDAAASSSIGLKDEIRHHD